MKGNHRAVSPGGIASFAVTVALLSLAVSAPAATTNCRQNATALRESLEVVVEATIDGRTAEVPGAAERTATWWKSHHQAFHHGPGAARLMDAMVGSAKKGDSREAARAAVQVAVESFKWCPGTLRTDDQLMLLDFVGMTGWLRAHGASIGWPNGVKASTSSLAAQLSKRGKAALAKQLRAAVQSTMATRVNGDAKPSTQLLSLVDTVETVLR